MKTADLAFGSGIIVRGVPLRQGRWVVAAEGQGTRCVRRWGDFHVAAQLGCATSSGSSNPGATLELPFRALEIVSGCH
jgi:hypothetical protein